MKVLGLTSNLFTGVLPPFFARYPFAPVPAIPATYNTTGVPAVPPTVLQAVGPPLTVCNAGLYTSGTIEDGVGGTSLYPGTRCSVCLLGTVAPYIGATFCIPCPANAHAAGDGISYAACPAHSASPPGSQSVANCSCAIGFVQSPAQPSGAFTCDACAAGAFYDVPSGSCLACAPGSYAPSSGSFSCLQVPAGSHSSYDSTSYVTCGGGTYAVNGACEACAQGTFAPLNGSTTCTPVPPVRCTSNLPITDRDLPPPSHLTGFVSLNRPLELRLLPRGDVSEHDRPAGLGVPAVRARPGVVRPVVRVPAVRRGLLQQRPRHAVPQLPRRRHFSAAIQRRGRVRVHLRRVRPRRGGSCKISASATSPPLPASSVGAIAGGVVGAFALLLIAAGVLLRRAVRRRAVVAGWKAFIADASEVVLGPQLGSGGFASVYSATWRGTAVAVKIMNGLAVSIGAPATGKRRKDSLTKLASSPKPSSTMSSTDPEFAREVAFLGRLRHPNGAGASRSMHPVRRCALTLTFPNNSAGCVRGCAPPADDARDGAWDRRQPD